MKKAETELIPQETIEGKILLIMGKKVMFAAANLPGHDLIGIWLFFMALLQAI